MSLLLFSNKKYKQLTIVTVLQMGTVRPIEICFLKSCGQGKGLNLGYLTPESSLVLQLFYSGLLCKGRYVSFSREWESVGKF
jgi:hypothetical protein